MIDRGWAETFAREWVDAWNAHDLERIFLLYSDDFEMTSPLIVERMGVPSGTLKGKNAVRPYWSQGLASMPNLRFELRSVLMGVDSVAIVYRSVTQAKMVIELFEFDKDRLVTRSEALHGLPE